MRIVPALASLLLAVSLAGAEGLPRTMSQGTPPDSRPPSGAIVTRDDARRELRAWLPSAETNAATRIGPTAVRGGRLIVRNRSGISADVYLADPSDDPEWVLMGTVDAGYKLIIYPLARRAEYFIAVDETGSTDEFWGWGPTSFIMRRRYRFTLLD
jgi:hypothetical protein